jgi:oxygen-dependent protoporphyrinogen oxidase
MRRIAIIGGGISGLSVLHYLKKRYSENIDVTLYEAHSAVGGSVTSFSVQGFIFEAGPNGFLTNQPHTLELIDELGFSNQIIEANEHSKRRYIQINGQLQLVPSNLVSFIQTPLLSISEKIRFIQGFFIKNVSKNQSIYDYTSRRFGLGVTEHLVDPFLTGIYAGNIKRLHMESTFPKFTPRKKSKMCSFKNGMGSFMGSLYQRYKSSIQTGVEIKSLDQIKADDVICTIPAYAAADLLGIDLLNRIVYSPVAVVGLLIKKTSMKKMPDGFGYLIPSSEKKKILGVLLESNIFTRDQNPELIFLRVMLGGMHHPTITKHTQEELVHLAIQEIEATYGLKERPANTFVRIWPKGIPQYDLDYPRIRSTINEEFKKSSHLYVCGSYLDGVSFNDCIKNARKLVYSL